MLLLVHFFLFLELHLAVFTLNQVNKKSNPYFKFKDIFILKDVFFFLILI